MTKSHRSERFAGNVAKGTRNASCKPGLLRTGRIENRSGQNPRVLDQQSSNGLALAWREKL